jgi:hypothetical protein
MTRRAAESRRLATPFGQELGLEHDGLRRGGESSAWLRASVRGCCCLGRATGAPSRGRSRRTRPRLRAGLATSMESANRRDRRVRNCPELVFIQVGGNGRREVVPLRLRISSLSGTSARFPQLADSRSVVWPTSLLYSLRASMAEQPSRPFYGEYAWAFDLLIDRPVGQECAAITAWFSERASFRAQRFLMPAVEQADMLANSRAEVMRLKE